MPTVLSFFAAAFCAATVIAQSSPAPEEPTTTGGSTPTITQTLSIPDAIQSKIESEVSTYVDALTAGPGFAALEQIVSELDPTLRSQFDNYQSAFATATVEPSWVAALPSDLRNFYGSIADAEQSVEAKYQSSLMAEQGSATTGAPPSNTLSISTGSLDPSAASTTTSDNVAPHQTGAVKAAGMVAAGVLGLAAML
ncbi:MAG: hypothetical protein M1833_006244 [Piccolia ochrophora]|nr:MAG: hypothetical protein M1833_006244 [Piccolia ochrophora]